MRKNDNLSRYLADSVRYGYYTNEELKRVSESPILKHETYSREYTIEANVRNARYQMQRESINGNVYVVPHYACRPSHLPYQDMVYTKKTFDEKIAYPNNPDGIGCLNCRHEVVEHYNGIEDQYDSSFRNTEELIQQYNDEQKMRKYENEIRKLKLMGEGNDEQLRKAYARMMGHSRNTNTPIQINRTWTINASRYNVSMPNKRLDMMNLLPRYTNESFDYGFVKTTARMTGKRASYFIDGIDISDCNFFPESVRTAYTGRAYGVGKDMTEQAFKSSMETIIHTSQSDGVTLMWADKTTTNVLNATGCFFIPEKTAVDDVNPFDIYEDITKHEVSKDKLTPKSYGIYVDDDGVWRFFYGEIDEKEHIYDLSREPNRAKVTSKVMDIPIVKNPIPETYSLQNTQHDNLIDRLSNSTVSSNAMVKHSIIPNEDEIIKRIGGADKTNGSCASLAYVYCANKYGGWNVLDFRGGESCDFFANRLRRYHILYNDNKFPNGTIMPQMKTTKAFFNRATKQMETNVEYWCTAGRHCAILKKDANGKVWYLELQNDDPKWICNNGVRWKNDVDMLIWRFGTRTNDTNATLVRCDAIDYNDEKILDALTFINTDESKQEKGKGGGIK